MRTLPRVIAICGPKRSGKDVIADHLAQAYGYRPVKIAAPLKAVVKLLFGFTDEQLECDLKEVKDPVWKATPRSIMQYIGTDVMQLGIQKHVPGIGRTFWVEKLFRDTSHSNMVISDLRFPHEVGVIAHMSQGDYLIIRVTRKMQEEVNGEETPEHCSELEHTDIVPHFVVANDGSIKDLLAAVDDWMASSDDLI